MKFWFRTASFAVSCFCAFAAAGGLTGGSAGSAQTLPGVEIAPLPTVEAPQHQDGDGIALQEQANAEPVQDAPLPKTLPALVERFASSDAGSDELQCLATAVYFESKGEPLAGQLAVARVILNRAKSGRFASSACGVVKQPSQFSFVRRGAMPPAPRTAQWRQAVGIAQVALQDLYRGPAADALYFHARRIAPGWNRPRVGAVGNHVFYR